MEEEVSLTSLPWCWVIETLARSQQVGSAILYGLLSKAPPLYGKSGKEAREAVALRCLEEFCGPYRGSIDNHPTSHLSQAGFNASDSYEDVLQRVLPESSGSDWQKDASDELKWDVRSFIELKKSVLPRSSLELLKNVIVEGTHPLAASLEDVRELALPSQHVSTIASGSVDPAFTLSIVKEDARNDQAMLAEKNGVSSEQRTSDQLEHASLPNGNSMHSERDTSIDLVRKADDTIFGLDYRETPVKKLKLDKQDGVLSQQQASVPCDGSDVSNSAGDGQNHQSPKASQKHSVNSNGENLVESGKTIIYSDDQPQTSHDNGHHPEETDLGKKMLAFLSSQSILPDDSLVMTESVVNFCMKCNKGGELLICCANTCLLAFHESCLGCSASFDDQGKFYCPFCAYSRAISEYVKAKEKVSLARKELSLFIGGKISDQAEPDSTRTLGNDVNQQKQNEDIHETTEPKNGVNVVTEVANRRQRRSSKNKQQEVSALPAAMAENAFITAAENLSSEDRQGVYVVTKVANRRQLRSSKNKQQEVSALPAGMAENVFIAAAENLSSEDRQGVNVVTEVANRRQLRSSKNKQQDVSASPAGMAENAFISAAENLSAEDTEGAEIIAQLARDTIRILNQGQDNHNTAGGNPSQRNGKTIKTSPRRSNLNRKKEATEHQATEHQVDVNSESISDSDGLSDDGKNKTNISVLSPRPLRGLPPSHLSRRKKVPWTAEEEAMLRKGVEKFVQGENKAIPWKSILEFGGSVFQYGRTAVDLKDKWRNIMRGSPKVK